MPKINKYLGLMLFGLILISLALTSTISAIPDLDNNLSTSNIVNPIEKNSIEANAYNADIHWVETNITINDKGKGVVSIEVNCTIAEGHLGIYFKNFEDNANFLVDESYAYTNDEILAINFTSINVLDPLILVSLVNNSKAIADNSILYVIFYETNFYLNNQLSRYQVDTSLVTANFDRPIWEDELDYQIMRIQLPIEVTDSSISASFLEEIKFDVSQQVEDNYNTSYYGKIDTNGKYWFVFVLEKSGNLPENSAFQAIFYLAFNYFSFPLMISWFVILAVFIISILGLSFLIVVISLTKSSKKEMKEFKEEFYEILKKQEIN